MLILNQDGNEAFVVENLTTIKYAKQTENQIHNWQVLANVPEYEQYAILGKYSTEAKAKAAFKKILVNYDNDDRVYEMPLSEDGVTA